MKIWPWADSVKARQEKEERLAKEVARAMKGMMVKESRAFAAAQFNRLTASWVASSTSPDAELWGSLRTLRDRARELGRNNDYAKNFYKVVQDNVIGRGVKLQSKVVKENGELDEGVNNLIEAKWDRWCRRNHCDVAGELDFFEIERLIMKTMAEGGEVYVRKVYKSFGGSKIKFAIQVFEGDHVDEEYNGISSAGNEIRFGIEKDKWGRRVAYYIKEKHPGDSFSPHQSRKGSVVQRVPAEEIIPIFIPERIGQSRGYPWLASAIMRLHHMQGYEESEIVGARASAASMGFIESGDPESGVDEEFDGQEVSSFEPGTIKRLAPGEKFTSTNFNKPSGNLSPFMSYMLRGVAAGAGTSYETISKDFTASTYFSARVGLISERDAWRILQAWIISRFHREIYESWVEAAVMSGSLPFGDYELNPEKYNAAGWMARGWAWVDPSKEVSAHKQAVLGGFTSLSNIYAEEGKDFEETMIQRQRELKIIKKLGLSFDTDAADLGDTKTNNSQDAKVGDEED